MNARQYKSLCRRIYRRFGKPLKMDYFSACECADLVLFGDTTEDALFLNLQQSVSEENCTSNH